MLTPSERRAFNLIALRFDLPFTIPDAQHVTSGQVGSAVVKKCIQKLRQLGELEHVGNDRERKLWWWADEPIAS